VHTHIPVPQSPRLFVLQLSQSLTHLVWLVAAGVQFETSSFLPYSSPVTREQQAASPFIGYVILHCMSESMTALSETGVKPRPSLVASP